MPLFIRIIVVPDYYVPRRSSPIYCMFNLATIGMLILLAASLPLSTWERCCRMDCQPAQQHEEYIYPWCVRLPEIVRQWSRHSFSPPFDFFYWSHMDRHYFLLPFHNLATYAAFLSIYCSLSSQALFRVNWCQICISLHRRKSLDTHRSIRLWGSLFDPPIDWHHGRTSRWVRQALQQSCGMITLSSAEGYMQNVRPASTQRHHIDVH